MGPEFPLNDFFRGTTVGTTDNKRVRVEPGIYRRGPVHDVQVTYRDPSGRRHQKWAVVHGGIREARNARTRLKATALEGNLVPNPDGKALTMAAFLADQYLPHLEERVAQNDLSKNTLKVYRRYVNKKVIPAIGTLRVDQIRTGDIEAMLNKLLAGGRDPTAGKGRPARYPEEVYDLISSCRARGWTYSDIAVLVSARYGGNGIALSKNAVASICRRRTTVRPVQPNPDGLSEETVRKVYWMLNSAWSFGVKYELIPRSRGYIVAEAKCPTEGRWKQEKVKLLWTPEQCSRFFDWAVPNRPVSWPAFYFVTVSGDRPSADLGLAWHEVDLDRGTASLVNFVKYLGEPGERVLVEPVGKTSRGHQIDLDPRTVAVLRNWKAYQSERLLTRSDRHTCITPGRDCPLPGYHDRGLVFPQRDGNYRDPNKFLDLFKDAVLAFNRRHPEDPLPVIDLYSFRHGWATTSEAAGVSEVVRMDRLDHKTVKMSRHYTQALPAAKAAAAAAVSDALFARSVELGSLGS